MRIKPMIILAAVITAACLVTAAYGGNEEMKITAGEDWSWESGAVDLIEGEIDLSEYTGKELSVRISTDLPYESEEEAKSRGPVFVSVNGKRITVKKQSDTARCTPSAEETAMRFTSTFSLPDKKRAYTIVFTLTVSDEEGQELKTFTASIDGKKAGTGNMFFITADINRIAVLIGIAAAAVWAAALFRAFYLRKKEKTGD